MNLGINKPDETFPLEVKLMDSEVLRVTQDGQFIWHPDADRMIEKGDFSFSPAMPHILRTLRKRKWVGLTNNELQPIADEYRILFGSWVEDFARAIETKLKEKNT